MGNLTDHFAGGGGGSNILEILSSPCDGRTVTVSSGTYTIQNVTTYSNPSTTYIDFPGSVISYLPPEGTTKVMYEFSTQTGWDGTHAITDCRLYIAGTEVTAAKRGVGGQYDQSITDFRWTFAIGDTADAANGVVTSWDTAKELKWMVRNYGPGNDNYINASRYRDGGSSFYFCRPVLTITALS
jgi:hypothetical protein